MNFEETAEATQDKEKENIATLAPPVATPVRNTAAEHPKPEATPNQVAVDSAEETSPAVATPEPTAPDSDPAEKGADEKGDNADATPVQDSSRKACYFVVAVLVKSVANKYHERSGWYLVQSISMKNIFQNVCI